MKTLLDNQVSAIEKLHRFKVGALFMEPGTGKTRAAYELIKSLPECDYVLWLTPYQTKENLPLHRIAEGIGMEAEEVVIYSRGASVAKDAGAEIEFSNSWERNPDDVIMYKNKRFNEYEEN